MRQNRISTFIPVSCFFRSSLFCTLALPITKNHLDTIGYVGKPIHQPKKKRLSVQANRQPLILRNTNLLHLVNDGFESLGIVHSEIGQHFTVDLDTSLVKGPHELRVAQVLHAGCRIDDGHDKRR